MTVTELRERMQCSKVRGVVNQLLRHGTLTGMSGQLSPVCSMRKGVPLNSTQMNHREEAHEIY
jgi:hypothetical protein